MKHETFDNAIEEGLFNRFYNLVDRISKLDNKMKLIQNFDELLHKYQTMSRNSNLLNYVTKKDIQNRIEKENKHYSD